MSAAEKIEPEALLSALNVLIEKLSAPRVALNDELWTVDEVATYMKLAPDTVGRRVVTRPDFPVPVQPCGTGKNAQKRWFAGAVITWARQNSSKLPKGRQR